MRAWAKGMLVAAAICVGTGAALCVGGWAMGGRFSQLRHRHYGLTTEEDTAIVEEQTGPSIRERREEDEAFVSHHSKEQVAEAGVFWGPPWYQGQEITKMEISLAGGAVEVIWDDETDGIQVICDNERYQCVQETDHGTLEIWISRKGGTAKSLLNPETYEDWDETAAQIKIPAGGWMEEVELEVRGGALTVTGLCGDKLDLEVDAGKLEVLNGSVGELDGQCRAGELIFEGTAHEKIEAECLAGAISYVLEGKKEDFNYEMEVLGGSILLDGEEQGRLKGETELNHAGAGKKAKLECKAGSVKVDFYEGD